MQSMTGFGRGTASTCGREVIIELKSVNHRFLDINTRLPRSVSFVEDTLRKTISANLSRGHVEVYITYQNNREDSKSIEIDLPLLKEYLKAFETIKQMGIDNTIDTALVSKLPDVLKVTETEDDQQIILQLVQAATQNACNQLVEMRSLEGKKLHDDLLNKLEAIQNGTKTIIELTKDAPKEYATKLKARLSELIEETNLDEQRIAMEIAIYADRISIDEELVRLDAHITHMKEYMQAGAEIGRKLDFLIQEFNREVNTIGSKAMNAEIQAIVIYLKGEIEKMREQIQNIE